MRTTPRRNTKNEYSTCRYPVIIACCDAAGRWSCRTRDFSATATGSRQNLSQRINKISFAGLALEFAVVPEMQSAALEIEVRQLNAASQIQSGVGSISGVFEELQWALGPG
jgi:hypothetical protein